MFNCGPLVLVLPLFQKNFSVGPRFITQSVFQSLLVDTLECYYYSENIFRSSSIDSIIFNCGPLTMDTSLVLEGFFGRSRISPITKGLKSSSLRSSFRCSTKRNFSKGPALSIGPFQKVQREVIYFLYVVRKSENPP